MLRFDGRLLYEEDFVIATRKKHSLGKRLALERYAAAGHLLVTRTGDVRGFVDDVLARHGLPRRVVLTMPSFMWALAALAESDLVAALPRTLVRVHGPRFGVTAVEPPVRIGYSKICAVATRPAMTDTGVAWLIGLLERVLRARSAESASR